MALRVINAEDVQALLPMADCIEVMEQAMVAASLGRVAVPARLIAPIIDSTGFFALMSGSSSQLQVYGAKVVSLHPDNPAAGRPAIQGFVTLFEHATGTPCAIVEGAEITAIRTAAASGLATRWLARKSAKSHGILGTGVQAASHIEAIQAARPGLSEIVIWGRSHDKASDLARRQAARTGLKIRASERVEEAAACDIVSVVTGAAQPVLKGDWLMPGGHVNLVGAHNAKTREADTRAIQRSQVYVDLLESAKNEAGDILIPISEGAIGIGHVRGEIGRLIHGDIAGRATDEEITLYKSLGLTAQDLYAAKFVYDRAVQLGRGTLVTL